MNSNSPSLAMRPQLPCELVKDAVDVSMAIGATEGLGELDGLIDHDAIWHLGNIQQFVCRQKQDGVLDRRELGQRPVAVWCEMRPENFGPGKRAVKNAVEVLPVAALVSLLLAEKGIDHTGIAGSQKPLIDALNAETAGCPPASPGKTIRPDLCRLSHRRH